MTESQATATISDEEFCEIVGALFAILTPAVRELKVLAVAEVSNYPVPIVNRWRLGKGCPRDLIKPVVLDQIRQQLLIAYDDAGKFGEALNQMYLLSGDVSERSDFITFICSEHNMKIVSAPRGLISIKSLGGRVENRAVIESAARYLYRQGKLKPV